MIFLPNPQPEGPQSVYCFTEARRKGCCNLAANPRGQLAAFARRRDTDLEWSIGICGEERESAEVWGVGDIDGYTQPAA